MDGSSLGLTPLSRVHLDELLQELLDRVGEVVTSRERLRALLDAVVVIGSDLDLRSTLQRITKSACQLTDAKYGALGVIGPDQLLAEFITHGLTPAQHAAIGDLPRGHGVLGLLIREPRPIRLPDIAKHPQAHGFPPHHPVMRTFLGVPIRIRDQVFGNLYLSEKTGGGQFTDDDEELVMALAVAAAAAIDNARLYAQMRRRQRWLEATAEITTVLLGEVDRSAALRLVAARAREVAGADLTMVLLCGDDADRLTVEVADGPAGAALVGMQLPVEGSELATVLEERGLAVASDLSEVADWPVPVASGSALLVPLAAERGPLGVLVVAYEPSSISFTGDPDVALVQTFAGQAALALERSRAQEEREQLAVLGDRERIARDLHDVVIQRLFGAGMQLQSTIHSANRPDVAARINRVVDDLDTTIRDIRGAIFELRQPASGALRAEIRAVVDEARAALGFRPELVLDGPVDSAVPDQVGLTLLAVLREALSNAARHARASSVRVTVRAAGGSLQLEVVDDGVGPAGIRPTGGLLNLRKRAEDLGGTFEVEPASSTGTGTLLRWTVPT